MKKPSRAGKVAHGLGLSTWFGGTLFGQVSLNPAVSGHGSRLGLDRLGRAKVAWSPLAPPFGVAQMQAVPIGLDRRPSMRARACSTNL
jgi:hypothetical protein